MATSDDVKRAQSRRAKRESAQAKAEIEAKATLAKQAKPARKTAEVRRKEVEEQIEAPLKRATTVTRENKKLKKAAAQVAARRQAQADMMRSPELPPLDVPVGETPPLHVLRARNKLIEAQERDAATEIAVEIGKSARDLLAGRELRGRHSRFRRIAEAETLRARMKQPEKQE